MKVGFSLPLQQRVTNTSQNQHHAGMVGLKQLQQDTVSFSGLFGPRKPKKEATKKAIEMVKEFGLSPEEEEKAVKSVIKLENYGSTALLNGETYLFELHKKSPEKAKKLAEFICKNAKEINPYLGSSIVLNFEDDFKQIGINLDLD